MKTIWNFLLAITFIIISFNSCSNQSLLLNEESEREQEESKVELIGLVNLYQNTIIFSDTKGIRYYLDDNSKDVLLPFLDQTILISGTVVSHRCINTGIRYYLANVEIQK